MPSLAHWFSIEQRHFLRRSRRQWGEHLARTRSFLGSGLQAADPKRPVLILGAGSGLEIPWSLAPPLTHGWDADPWSRIRTALRHQRWAPWHFGDFTGRLEALYQTICRNLPPPASRQDPAKMAVARRRVAGLLPGLAHQPQALRGTLEALEPGTILLANVAGQIGVVAQRWVEAAFRPASPWEADPEVQDPLAEALDAWIAQTLRLLMQTLQESGAALWMVHDRMTFAGEAHLSLGAFHNNWRDQIKGSGWLDAADPLVGLDFPELLLRTPDRWERWLWPLADDQVHLMEAMAFSASEGSAVGGFPARCTVPPTSDGPVSAPCTERTGEIPPR